jgi:hypothetical protein
MVRFKNKMFPKISLKNATITIVLLSIIVIILIVTTSIFANKFFQNTENQDEEKNDASCVDIAKSGDIVFTDVFSKDIFRSSSFSSEINGNVNNKLFNIQPEIDDENIIVAKSIVSSKNIGIMLQRNGDLSNVTDIFIGGAVVNVNTKLNFLEITFLKDNTSYGYIQPSSDGIDWLASTVSLNTKPNLLTKIITDELDSDPKIILNNNIPIILCTSTANKFISVITAIDENGSSFEGMNEVPGIYDLITDQKQITILQEGENVAVAYKSINPAEPSTVLFNVATSDDGFKSIMSNTIVASVPENEVDASTPCIITKGTSKGSIFVGVATKSTSNNFFIYLATDILSDTFANVFKIAFSSETLFASIQWYMGTFETNNEVVVFGLNGQGKNVILSSNDSFQSKQSDKLTISPTEKTNNPNINLSFSSPNNVAEILVNGTYKSSTPFVVKLTRTFDDWESTDVIPRGLSTLAYTLISKERDNHSLFLTASYDDNSYIVRTGLTGGTDRHVVDYSVSSS